VINWPGAPKDDYLAQWSTEAIAELYKWGKGVPQDDKLAVEWFQRSVDVGSISSINELAWMYRNGRGVGKNEQVAQALSDRYNKIMAARQTPEEKIPDCEISKLESSLSLHRNVNTGDVEAIFQLENLSSQTCRVNEAQPNFASPAKRENFPVKTCRNCAGDGRAGVSSPVVLPPGGFAHMSVQWKDTPQAGGPECLPISGMDVAIFFRTAPPKGTLAIGFAQPLPEVCSAANYTSLISGRDPYLSVVDVSRLSALKIYAPKTTFYPREQMYLRVIVPGSEPLPPKRLCPHLFLLERGQSGTANYLSRGGSNDYGCRVLATEHGDATLAMKLYLWPGHEPGERSLQLFQYNSTGTDKNAWQLIAQSAPFNYRVGDPEKIVRTWGPEVKGLVLDVTVDTTIYSVGDQISAHVAFRNIDANQPIGLPLCNMVDLVIQDAGGQRIYPRNDDDLSCNFSGPGGNPNPPIAQGHIVTVEQYLSLGDLPPGTYTLLGRWEAHATLPCSPGLVCSDPSGQPAPPYAVVTSNQIAIHVVAAKPSTPPVARKP
jgi:hypothetical protein